MCRNAGVLGNGHTESTGGNTDAHMWAHRTIMEETDDVGGHRATGHSRLQPPLVAETVNVGAVQGVRAGAGVGAHHLS